MSFLQEYPNFHRNLLRILLAAVLIFISIFLVFLRQTQAISISPVRIEMAVDPGRSEQGVFKVINDEAEGKLFYTSFENFEATGETGNPNFIPGREGLASWISAPSQIIVGPGETKEVPFTINVPRNADPGGYFAAIFLSTSPPQSNRGGEVTIGARIGTLLLFRVNGDIKEGGALLEFGIKDNQKLFTSLPVPFYYRFQNAGDDRVRPVGNITIKNTLGMTSQVINANISQGNVLPQSIRRFESSWLETSGKQQAVDAAVPESAGGKGFFAAAKAQAKNFALGRYTAELGITYGQANQQTELAYVSFWVIPWQLLVLILVLLLIVYWILTRGLRKYNRWVIRRAGLK